MKPSVWQIQEAKNRFSEVVELARHEGRQTITKHGKPVVVMLSVESFEKLQQNRSRATASGKGLVQLLRRCPAPEVFDLIEESRSREPARDLDLF